MTELESLARSTLLPSFAGDAPPDWLLREVDAGLAGVTLFAINGNMPDSAGLAALTGALRRAGDPLIATDEEGGDVTRLAHLTGSPYPGNAALGAVDDPDLTAGVYRSLGAELAQAGVNLDFAPTVDVNTVPDNPIIGTRAFGGDPALVARHTTAAVRGLQDAGIAACAKHFPGHGATAVDSHHEAPVVDADRELLARRELVPFDAAIAAGCRAVMLGHLIVPAVTGTTPATLSPGAVALLRDELGFTGVIVTDALDMRGASGRIGIPEASVRALIAGADLLCLGPRERRDSLASVIVAIRQAVEAGRLSVDRLAESAERVRELKAWLTRPASSAADPGIGIEAARRAVLTTGEPRLTAPPLVIEANAPANIAVGPVPWGFGRWLPADDVLRVDPDDADAHALATAANGRPVVLVLRDAHRHLAQRALATALRSARPDTIVVELGLPIWRPPDGQYVAAYGATLANTTAVAELLGLTARLS
ncbi:beta-N-acetylhexosaminidase [Herbihabitans rhizosphaerae]|uniref:Beta-N-acetylhexosaminidase n=1 Tax=Herbihabitans rhizosphaerae TaxID=1872711 RepID=A0A4Q7KRZ9_9PSEU|nr:glycoside hydrolase family 3 N-terminal domain-containing protein [Herbihabitans rhizosphaerae]RZS39196.1 beta-N-acetylhexosaminidase [Herbihabitans rhizosphaerae]